MKHNLTIKLEAVLLKLNRLAKQAACNFNRSPKVEPVIKS